MLGRDEFDRLDKSKRIIKDDDNPEKANVNYFRQFTELDSIWGVTYVDTLVDSLKAKFTNVNENVISGRYQQRIEDEKVKIARSMETIRNYEEVITINTP